MILAAERATNSNSPPLAALAYNPRSRDSSPHGSLHSNTSGYGAPRLLRDRDRERDASAFTPNADYQFSMLPSAPNPHLRKASAGPTGKILSNPTSSPTSNSTGSHPSVSQGYQETISSIYTESGPFQPGGMGLPTGSHVGGRRLGPSTRRSASPSVYHTRSGSPTAASLSLSPLSSPPFNLGMQSSSRTLVTENDTIIDLDSAYRRLSDDALRNSGGSLANLPERGGVASHIRANSGESITRDGGVRLEKDLTFTVGDDGREIAVESSDESDYSTDEDAENSRGRRSEQDIPSDNPEPNDKKPRSQQVSTKKPSPDLIKSSSQRKTMSLLAAAEEES